MASFFSRRWLTQSTSGQHAENKGMWTAQLWIEHYSIPHPKAQGSSWRKGQKGYNSQSWCVDICSKTEFWWTWQGLCIHKLKATMIACTRTTQEQVRQNLRMERGQTYEVLFPSSMMRSNWQFRAAGRRRASFLQGYNPWEVIYTHHTKGLRVLRNQHMKLGRNSREEG